MENKSRVRIVNYDLLRILAASMVVMLHLSASKWLIVSPESSNWMIMNFFNSLTRSAVPLFFMLSGAFLLRREIELKKLYLKKIVPLVVIYFTWSLLYAIDSVGLSKLNEIEVLVFIKMLLQGHYHLWFIPTLIGLYILQPILVAIVKYEDGKYIPYALIYFLIFGVFQPTILSFVDSYETAVIALELIPVELTRYTGYMLLGYYLANKSSLKWKPIVTIVSFFIVVIIATIIGQWDALQTGQASSILLGYFKLPVVIEAILLFIFFKNLKLTTGRTMTTLIERGASLTMGVFLLHPFVMGQLATKFGLDILTFTPWISILLLTFVVVSICIFVTFIMLKLPYVRYVWKL